MVAVVLRVRTGAVAAAVATTRETQTVAVVTDAIPAITAVVTTDADKKGVSFSGCPLFFLELQKI